MATFLVALLLSGCGEDGVMAGQSALLARERDLAQEISAAPRDAALQVDLADVQLALGNGVGAEAALRQAAALGGDPDRLRPRAARAILLQGEEERALTLLNSGPVHPDAAGEAGHVAGILHLALGNLDAARAGFDIAIRERPRNSGLWVDVARYRDANADAAGARDAADYAIELDPDNAAALALKGNLVRVQAGLAASLPWYERALAIDPGNVDALLDHAATLGDLGQYRAMLDKVRLAARLAPTAPRPFLLQAIIAARAGNYRLARSLLQRTQGKLDAEPVFLLLNTVVELELDGAAVAADYAAKLLSLQPHNLTARRLLAAANWASGDRDGAAATLAPIVERGDADSWSLQLAARTAAERGDSAAAAGYLARAAALVRGNAAAFAEADPYGLRSAEADAAPLDPVRVIPAIRAEMTRGDVQSAHDRAGRLVGANRGVADAQILYGDTALAVGEWRTAIRAFRDARALDASARTALRLANAQHLAGDPAGAAATILSLQQGQGTAVVADRLSGHLAMDLQQWGNALGYFERVRRTTGNRDVVVLRELARAYAMTGDTARADALAMLAVRLQPLNRELVLLWAEQRAAMGEKGDAAALREKAAGMR